MGGAGLAGEGHLCGGFYVVWLRVKCTYGNLGAVGYIIGAFFTAAAPPRRHGRQLRPPPAKSLAFGRGRRHNPYFEGTLDKWFISGLVNMGKGFVFMIDGKWTFTTIYSIMGFIDHKVLGKGSTGFCVDYNFVHVEH